MHINPDLLAVQLNKVHGINISMYEDTFVKKSILQRMMAIHSDSFEDYRIHVEKNEGEGKTLCDSLHIHYSEFFRDPFTYALIEHCVIPDLIQKISTQKNNEIRIWSCGTAAGQEAYSIAMLLEEGKTNTNCKYTYRIFATDIDDNSLQEARIGIYPEYALGNVSLKRVKRWFDRHGDAYAVKPKIKKCVEFSLFNILGSSKVCPPASIFGNFDLVFCCNVMIYYKPESRKKILDKLGYCASSEGYLITGETERTIALDYGFKEAYPQAAIFHINQGRRNLQ